jgi:hypothetical protein
LAPIWRELAKVSEGVARIGAVNCAEDPNLCRSQNVMGYPSLIVYPQEVWFQGFLFLGFWFMKFLKKLIYL